MRLFIAVPLNDEIKEHLRALQAKIAYAKVTLVRDFHLTLKFLGEVAESRLDDIKLALGHVNIRPFVLSLSDIGFFPSQKKARVIWVGNEPKENITELQKKIDDSMLSIGFKREKRFHPHITLARVKYIADRERFCESTGEIKAEKITCPVSSFDLIKSTLTPSGPEYKVIKTFINKQ